MASVEPDRRDVRQGCERRRLSGGNGDHQRHRRRTGGEGDVCCGFLSVTEAVPRSESPRKAHFGKRAGSKSTSRSGTGTTTLVNADNSRSGALRDNETAWILLFDAALPRKCAFRVGSTIEPRLEPARAPTTPPAKTQPPPRTRVETAQADGRPSGRPNKMPFIPTISSTCAAITVRRLEPPRTRPPTPPSAPKTAQSPASP